MKNSIIIAIIIVVSVIIVAITCFALIGYFKNSNKQSDINDIPSYNKPISEMTNISDELYERVKMIIDTWSDEDIYAISFFVHSNEAFSYRGYENVTEFKISYNTESDCDGAGQYAEERWNYAFWQQNEYPIISTDEPNPLTDFLFDWYKQNGITNIGYENEESAYDENYNYIGKGPVGEYELVTLASDVAKRLQEERYIEKHFGKKIPIIIHGLEYPWYNIEATEKANINGEADVFLDTIVKLGF